MNELATVGKKVKEVRLWPLKVNINAYLNRDHDKFSPGTREFKEYWKEEQRRIIEGYWVEEVPGMWMYMPADVYWYLNHYKIYKFDKKTKARIPIRPDPWDTVFIMGGDTLISYGFSGFMDDPDYTCNWLVHKAEQIEEGVLDKEGEPLSFGELEKYNLSQAEYIWKNKEKGEMKKFMHPQDYVRMQWERPMGKPVYENPAEDYKLMTARGTGKTFFLSSCCSRSYKTDGRNYNERLVAGEEPIVELYVSSYKKDKVEEITKMMQLGLSSFDGGVKDKSLPPFYRRTQGQWLPNNEVFHLVVTRNAEGNLEKKKNVSRIAFGVVTVENPDGAVGKRRKIIWDDEFALNLAIRQYHDANKNSTEISNQKFGSRWYSGTSGNQSKIGPAKELYYDTYQSVAIPNYWENPNQLIGRFIPAEYSLDWAKDENFNTMLDVAMKHYDEVDAKLRARGDIAGLQNRMIYEPRYPSEMFLSSGQDILPSAQASAALAELEAMDYINSGTPDIGDFEYTDREKTKVRWVKQSDKIPITTYNMKKYRDITGAVIIHEHPVEDNPGLRRTNSLYKLSYDPTKLQDQGTSLACILVWKSTPNRAWDPEEMKDNVVCEWVGRREGFGNHDLCHMIAVYYDCMIMPEINLKDFIPYSKSRNMYYRLMPSPHESLGNLMKAYKGGSEVGVDLSNQFVKKQGLILLRKLLRTPIEKDEQGNTTKMMVHSLRSYRGLDELSQFVWAKNLNFDFVSAMIIIAIWLNQEEGIVEMDPEEEEIEENLKRGFTIQEHASVDDDPLAF
jgi:hypothetical protein